MATSSIVSFLLVFICFVDANSGGSRLLDIPIDLAEEAIIPFMNLATAHQLAATNLKFSKITKKHIQRMIARNYHEALGAMELSDDQFTRSFPLKQLPFHLPTNEREEKAAHREMTRFRLETGCVYGDPPDLTDIGGHVLVIGLSDLTHRYTVDRYLVTAFVDGKIEQCFVADPLNGFGGCIGRMFLEKIAMRLYDQQITGLYSVSVTARVWSTEITNNGF